MSDQPAPVRSYQRIFRPDRRIYQIEGHALPVPGGVPLRWLGYAVATLLVVIVVSARSSALSVLLAGLAGVAAWAAGGRLAGALAGVLALAAVTVLGVVLGLLDWPLRLVVLPGLAATLATQATPDGRPAHRFLASWLAVRVRGRRSLGRPVGVLGRPRMLRAAVWVARDEHEPGLRRSRVHGPAGVAFGAPMLVRQRRWPHRRHLARPLSARRRRRAVILDSVELGAGERLEVRP